MNIHVLYDIIEINEKDSFLTVIFLFISCRTVQVQVEVFLVDNIPLEDQVRINFLSRAYLLECNGIEIDVDNHYPFTLIVPSGHTKLVMNLNYRMYKPRYDRNGRYNRTDAYSYYYNSYKLEYFFEAGKSYRLDFNIEEGYDLLFFKGDKWILNIYNLTDKTTERIITRTGGPERYHD